MYRFRRPAHGICCHRYFDRCAAGLGIKDAEGRLSQVEKGECPVVPEEMPAWERWQVAQYGQPQQLSCNPAKYFALAITQCPESLRVQFPCDPSKLDYNFCTGKSGGVVVKGPAGLRAYVEAPGSWDERRRSFDMSVFLLRFTPELTPQQLDSLPSSLRQNMIWDNKVMRIPVPSVEERRQGCLNENQRLADCQSRVSDALKGSCGTWMDCSEVGEDPILKLQRFDRLILTSLEPLRCAWAPYSDLDGHMRVKCVGTDSMQSVHDELCAFRTPLATADGRQTLSLLRFTCCVYHTLF